MTLCPRTLPNMNFPHWPALAALLLIGHAGEARAALHPAQADYQVTFKGVSANGTMRLSGQGNGRWSYVLSAGNAVASISQATTFVEKGNRLVPLGGSDRSDYTLKKQAVTTHYDWSAGQVRWTGDVKPSRAGPVKLQPGDMDALLVNLALARDIPAGKPATYRMVENGKARTVVYKVAGREKLALAGRTLDTVRVVQSGGNKMTVAWVAAGVPFPVRIVQREGGKETVRLQLTSLD